MAIKIFCCYAREDEALLSRLRTQLVPLQREGLIEIWYDGEISAGTQWETELHQQLDTAQVILLLISRHFIASDYCYSVEMRKAVQRHERGEAYVIPIILSPVHWQETPFGKLQALPKNAKPLTIWRHRDEAFFNVVDGIRESIKKHDTSILSAAANDDIAAIAALKGLHRAEADISYPDITGYYRGTGYNKLINEEVDLTIEVKQLGKNISGHLNTLTPGWVGSGPFVGTIDIKGHIMLKIKSEAGDFEVSGEGSVYPDKSIRGIYAIEGYPDLGTWQVKRA